MTVISLPELAGLLEDAGANDTVAACHGTLCGALCVHDRYDALNWLRDVLPDDVAVPDAAQFTPAVAAATSALRDGQMRFAPLLPEDDAALAVRTAALAEWCEGFLYGFGTGRLSSTRLPPDVAEILADFAEITRAAADDGDDVEADEVAYAELFEYVRVGVQLVHDELAEFRGRARDAQG